MYNNRDKEVIKKQGQSLLAVLQGNPKGGNRGGRGGRGRPIEKSRFGRGPGQGLALDQCAYCRQGIGKEAGQTGFTRVISSNKKMLLR